MQTEVQTLKSPVLDFHIKTKALMKSHRYGRKELITLIDKTLAKVQDPNTQSNTTMIHGKMFYHLKLASSVLYVQSC